jgi:cytochrome c
MKKIVVLAACFVLVYSCNSSGEKKTSSVPTETPKGLEMITTLDCTTCHKITEKNIGPAYTDVAKKYENTEANVEELAHKVISGGSGRWGTVPMTPHAISMDSAKEMVRYILSLRNQQ